MKYYVVSRYYNSGKTEAKIHLESEITINEEYFKETDSYDEYIDNFSSYEEAEKHKKEVENA